jgi:HD-like signal output (HDOD) protein
VGGYLIGLWGLPVPVVEAVALHHNPSRATSAEFSPLACVHVANALEAQRSKGPGGAAEKIDEEYLGRLGMAGRVPDWKKALYPE